jgi:hypothetical protein
VAEFESVGLQTLVVAMHKALSKLNPQFAGTCKGFLESPSSDMGKGLDQMKVWQAQAHKTLAALSRSN